MSHLVDDLHLSDDDDDDDNQLMMTMVMLVIEACLRKGTLLANYCFPLMMQITLISILVWLWNSVKCPSNSVHP